MFLHPPKQAVNWDINRLIIVNNNLLLLLLYGKGTGGIKDTIKNPVVHTG